ncbi:uncharacterized protein Dvir_GJ26158, partial [Drosophila virilis]
WQQRDGNWRRRRKRSDKIDNDPDQQLHDIGDQQQLQLQLEHEQKHKQQQQQQEQVLMSPPMRYVVIKQEQLEELEESVDQEQP